MIRECDILFAYYEKSNPSGFGMCAKMGYARGINKTIIFLNETDNRYMKFMECISNNAFNNFDLSTTCLCKMIELRQRQG